MVVPSDFIAGVLVAAVIAVGTAVMLPRPKPPPPIMPIEQVDTPEAAKVAAEMLNDASQAKINDIAADVRGAVSDIHSLKAEIKTLQMSQAKAQAVAPEKAPERK